MRLRPFFSFYGGKHRHGSSGLDFAHLAAWCLSLPGQVIVCEQAGADWLPFRPLGAMKTLNRKDGSRSYSQEVIYTQGCEPQESLFAERAC